MNDLLNQLFGLGGSGDALGFGTPGARLSFVHAVPAWIIAITIGVIVFGVWWSYRSLSGTRRARVVLGGARAIAMVLLGALALGPMIEQSITSSEQDWAMVLLDRSSSMSTRDVYAQGKATQSRDEQLRGMIEADTESWTALSEHKRVLWMGFGQRTELISEGVVPRFDRLGEATSPGTNIGQAIDRALDQASARPVSSLVIASDGRSIDAIDPELINRLKSAQIPIFVVALGDDGAGRDLGIARVEFPRAVFADDLVPIRVKLSSAGITASDIAQEPMRIELVDHATGEVISSAPIQESHLQLDEKSTDQSNGDPLAGHDWITLVHTPEQAGERELGLVIVSGNSDGGGLVDLNSSNDRSSVRLRVVDRPMRVLYIDGYPRWEHRYLKNLLMREDSITSSSMLLAASRRYMQEGEELISVIPSTLEQWEPFDVVIIGDVRPQLFADAQLESLLEHVTKHGAGVLWIAGASSTPTAWLDSPISALLPMYADAGGSQRVIHAWDSAVTMSSTIEADRLGVLGLNDERTGWLDRLSDPATGWSRLQWALELDEGDLKPGVSVLARASSVVNQRQSALVTMMRYGAGRSLFVGTDEIWRWRYGRGEDLPERFWLPMIRMLGRGTVDRRLARGELRISPTNPIPGKPTQITLRLFDQSTIDTLGDEITIELDPSSSIHEPISVVLRGSGDTRVGTWFPKHPGAYSASLSGVNNDLFGIVARTRVLDVSDEQRTLDTDHGLLAMLADETGGRVVPASEFDSIPGMMPNRTRTITSPPKQASLWDRPIVLILLVLLLTTEWVGRRILRLA